MSSDDTGIQTGKIECCDGSEVSALLGFEHGSSLVLTFCRPSLVVRDRVIHLASFAEQTRKTSDLLPSEVDVIYWNLDCVGHLRQVFEDRHLPEELQRQRGIFRGIRCDHRAVIRVSFEAFEDLHGGKIILLIAEIFLGHVVQAVALHVSVLPEPLKKVDLHHSRHVEKEEGVLTESVRAQISFYDGTASRFHPSEIMNFHGILAGQIIHQHLRTSMNILPIILPNVVPDQHIDLFLLHYFHPCVDNIVLVRT